MFPLLSLLESQGVGDYTLSGEVVILSNPFSGTTHQAGVRLNADGTVDKREDGVYTQIDSATDWVIPTDASSTQVYARALETNYTENQISAIFESTKAGSPYNSWQALGNGNTLEWYLNGNTSGSGEGTATWNLTIAIATDPGGSNIVASNAYTLTLELGGL